MKKEGIIFLIVVVIILIVLFFVFLYPRIQENKLKNDINEAAKSIAKPKCGPDECPGYDDKGNIICIKKTTTGEICKNFPNKPPKNTSLIYIHN